MSTNNTNPYGNPTNYPAFGADGLPLQTSRDQLMRSSHDKMLAGVLGGFAERYNVSSTLLRVLFVASFLLPGPQFLVYIAAWIIMPKRY